MAFKLARADSCNINVSHLPAAVLTSQTLLSDKFKEKRRRNFKYPQSRTKPGSAKPLSNAESSRNGATAASAELVLQHSRETRAPLSQRQAVVRFFVGFIGLQDLG